MKPASTIVIGATFTWLDDTALAGLEALAAPWFDRTVQPALHRFEVRLRLANPTNEESRSLAWKLYVELVTRISIAPEGDADGFNREALSSMNTMFGRLREALVAAGPAAAARVGAESDASIGAVVAVVLNVVLRPFLSYWHPLLEEHEATRPAGVSVRAHERAWSRHSKFREGLRELQASLASVAGVLEAALKIQGTAGLLPVPRGGAGG